MPSGVDNAVRWKLSYISAQAAAVLGVGAEPPPDSSEPRRYVARSDCGLSALRSAWVIWPTLSSRDIRESRSLTRAGTGSDGSWYGSGAAVAVAGAAAWAVTSVVTANAAVPTAAARRRDTARWPGCRLIAATPQGEDTSSDTRCATTPRLARRAEGGAIHAAAAAVQTHARVWPAWHLSSRVGAAHHSDGQLRSLLRDTRLAPPVARSGQLPLIAPEGYSSF